MSLTVKDVLIDDVITIRVDFPLNYADSLMKYFGVKCLVTLRDKIPVGIITLGDIEKKVYSIHGDPHQALVQDIMSEPLIWVKPDTPLDQAVEMLFEKDIDQLPIIGQLSSGPIILGMLTRALLKKDEPKTVTWS